MITTFGSRVSAIADGHSKVPDAVNKDNRHNRMAFRFDIICTFQHFDRPSDELNQVLAWEPTTASVGLRTADRFSASSFTDLAALAAAFRIVGVPNCQMRT